MDEKMEEAESESESEKEEVKERQTSPRVSHSPSVESLLLVPFHKLNVSDRMSACFRGGGGVWAVR